MREFFLNKMIIIYPISFPLQVLDFLSETNLRDIHVVDRVSRIGFSPIGLKLFDLLVRIYDIRVCEEENFWFSLFQRCISYIFLLLFFTTFTCKSFTHQDCIIVIRRLLILTSDKALKATHLAFPLLD